MPIMQIKKVGLCVALLLSLSHCSSYDFSRRIVQQGNILSPTQIQKLKIGMSKENVAIIMGSSLLKSPFTSNRWDYAYTWSKGSGPLRICHLVLYFKNNRLVQIEPLLNQNTI